MPDQSKKRIDYTKKNDKELRQIAKDILAGKIFTDRHVENIIVIPLIFPTLISGELKDYGEEQIKKIGMVYQYRDKADFDVDGMPVFLTAIIITEEEVKKVSEYYEELKILNASFGKMDYEFNLN